MRLGLSVIACLFTLCSCAQRHFAGKFSNGYTGATVSFTVSADGKWLTDLQFNGYWRCSGNTEQITAGPDQTLPIVNGEVKGVIVDPENGGSSAFRFALEGKLGAKAASGTFRMSIAGLSCDTYLLNWTATAK